MFCALICTSCFPTSSCPCSTRGTFSFLTKGDTQTVTVHQQKENSVELQLFHKPVTDRGILPAGPWGFAQSRLGSAVQGAGAEQRTHPLPPHQKHPTPRAVLPLCTRTDHKPWVTFLCSIEINRANVTVVVPPLSMDITKWYPWYLHDRSEITLFWKLPICLEHSLGNSADSRKIPNTHLLHS